MNKDEADTKAKELYGPKAYADDRGEDGTRILVDMSYSEGKKFYKTALLLGWGETWDEAIELAARRRKPITHEPTPPRQLNLF